MYGYGCEMASGVEWEVCGRLIRTQRLGDLSCI